MRLADYVRKLTGASDNEILLLRHSDSDINALTRLGAVDFDDLIEEFTAVQRCEDTYDFWRTDREQINVVAVIVRGRLYGIFRILGIETEDSLYSLCSLPFKRLNDLPNRSHKKHQLARRFRMQRLPSKADGCAVRGWEGGRSRTATSRQGSSFFFEIEVDVPDDTPLFANAQEFTNEELDAATDANRLRFGIVATSDQRVIQKLRRGQAAVRRATLQNYQFCCALCDISEPPLLWASHIVGWAECELSRGDLHNVICLCGFHDVLFENGYWSLDDDMRVIIRNEIQSETVRNVLPAGCQFKQPLKYVPGLEFRRKHRIKHSFEEHASEGDT